MTPATEPLTRERVLEATEEALRRYGPAKATVVDVARLLGVSHGSVYRHFPSKAALREAVTKRWLDVTALELADLTAGQGSAPERARVWLRGLFDAKRRKAGADPELFRTYMVLVEENSAVVHEHLAELVAQLTRILAAGVDEGSVKAADPGAAAWAVFHATGRFHDPAYAREWDNPRIEAEFDAVADLLLRGLRP
ncbi:TetR family transcriptional regulator [Streptomyces sp. NPDC051940]|uniref:TetR family transcriptional regulator n=1 Tax=Streptomyces sp. NPDC051940 TaxID=3155675 RepID=UPI0034272EDE